MTSRPRNGFLRSLSAASFARLRDPIEPVELEPARTISHVGHEVDWGYVPETCGISLVTMSSSGQGVETSMAGNEGARGFGRPPGPCSTVCRTPMGE